VTPGALFEAYRNTLPPVELHPDARLTDARLPVFASTAEVTGVS
jgi:hypothetical protein